MSLVIIPKYIVVSDYSANGEYGIAFYDTDDELGEALDRAEGFGETEHVIRIDDFVCAANVVSEYRDRKKNFREAALAKLTAEERRVLGI